MAKGKKTGGRDFEPGHPRMGGQAKIPEVVRQAQYLNRQEFIEIANKYLTMPAHQLVTAAQDKSLPVKEMIVASVLVHAINKGDPSRYEFILDRLLGRVPNNELVAHYVCNETEPEEDFSHMTTEELLILHRAFKRGQLPHQN